MAFYGESYRITIATNVAGTAITDDGLGTIRYHFDGASDTVTAGDSFIVGSEGEPLELTATDTAVVSWVVETGPASSGSLTLSSGLDPDWTGDDPADATQALGTLSASGEQTLVFGPAAITVADLFAFTAQPVAFIECASGTVEIQQVKLRAWPPGGASGAWVSGGPDYERTTGTTRRYGAAYTEGTVAPGTYASAWDDERAIVDNFAGQPDIEYSNGGSSMDAFFHVFFSGVTTPGEYGNAGAQVRLLEAVLPSPVPSPDLAWGYDPAEVWHEDAAFIRDLSGGVAVSQFVSWTPSSTVLLTDTYLGAIDLGDAPFDLAAHPTNPDWRMGNFYYPPTFTFHATDVPLADLGGQHIALGVIAPLYYGPAPTADTFTTAGAELGTTQFTSLSSGYQWFDPSASPQSPRFFVKDLDANWRPVGFGKPADESAVFKVPTAVGFYRDLTTAEYASHGPDSRPADGYPLKVKRLNDDGSTWWDHVAWMVPE